MEAVDFHLSVAVGDQGRQRRAGTQGGQQRANIGQPIMTAEHAVLAAIAARDVETSRRFIAKAHAQGQSLGIGQPGLAAIGPRHHARFFALFEIFRRRLNFQHDFQMLRVARRRNWQVALELGVEQAHATAIDLRNGELPTHVQRRFVGAG